MDPGVARADELVARPDVGEVLLDRLRHRRRGEVVERVEEPDRLAVVGDEVLEEEEVDVPAKVLEQREEVGVAAQRSVQRARLPDVVPPDALQGQVEAIGDPRMEAASTVDGRCPVDAVAGNKYRATDGVSAVLGQLVRGNLVDDAPGSPEQPRGDGVIRKVKDAQPGPVHEVALGLGLEGEQLTARQRLGPEDLVVPAQRRAELVGVLARRGVRVELEADVDRLEHGINLAGTRVRVRATCHHLAMSSFGWLDTDPAQRRRMLEVVDLFKDAGSVDELGIGAIRDALSVALSPGTSLLHTRLRYTLFISWLLRDAVSAGTPEQMAERFRNSEFTLIEALLRGGETQNVIGQEARRTLKRLPSAVYWAAIGRWGLCTRPISLTTYFRRATDVRHLAERATRTEEGEAGQFLPDDGFDPHLPPPPDRWLHSVDFALTPAE